MSSARIDRLTEAQRACLRRVLQHQTSKDIARELGVSPHTVDQRLRVAARTLGVSSRVEAARVLARHEDDGSEVYQSLAYQSSAIDLDAPASLVAGATAGDHDASHDQAVQYLRERQLTYQAFVPEPNRRIPLPLPISVGDENSFGGMERIGWIVAIAILSALSFGAILAGLQSLGTLMRGG